MCWSWSCTSRFKCILKAKYSVNRRFFLNFKLRTYLMCWKFLYTKQLCGVSNNHHCVKLCLCYQIIFVTYFRPLWVLNWGEGPELTDKKVNWWCSGGEQVEMLHINQWNAAAPGAEACRLLDNLYREDKYFMIFHNVNCRVHIVHKFHQLK